jgi:hypothetical protein
LFVLRTILFLLIYPRRCVLCPHMARHRMQGEGGLSHLVILITALLVYFLLLFSPSPLLSLSAVGNTRLLLLSFGSSPPLLRYRSMSLFFSAFSSRKQSEVLHVSLSSVTPSTSSSGLASPPRAPPATSQPVVPPMVAPLPAPRALSMLSPRGSDGG